MNKNKIFKLIAVVLTMSLFLTSSPILVSANDIIRTESEEIVQSAEPYIISEIVEAKKTCPLEDMCGALSETSRIQILKLLLEREELTCKDLEKIFNFSGSTAYHHITLLSKSGAVKIRTELIENTDNVTPCTPRSLKTASSLRLRSIPA